MYNTSLNNNLHATNSIIDMSTLADSVFLKLSTQDNKPTFTTKDNDSAIKLAFRMKSFLVDQAKTVTFLGEGEHHYCHSACLEVAQSLLMLEGYDKVLLIDADVQHPKIHNQTGASLSPGLCELLESVDTIDDSAELTINPGLYVLPAGVFQNTNSKYKLLINFNKLLDKVKQLFSIVIINSPELISSYNAEYLSSLSDAVIVVIQKGNVRKARVSEIRSVVKKAGSKSMGVIVTHG